eukprot:COSAG01_NODE_3761_length_5722_cov_2.962298_3_plen_112_part_00
MSLRSCVLFRLRSTYATPVLAKKYSRRSLCVLFRLRFTYATPVLAKKYSGWKRRARALAAPVIGAAWDAADAAAAGAGAQGSQSSAGASVMRVHWVAVPEAMRARRIMSSR